jgi:hypothetical protein
MELGEIGSRESAVCEQYNSQCIAEGHLGYGGGSGGEVVRVGFLVNRRPEQEVCLTGERTVPVSILC